ncbi:MAG: nucleotide exchange factor GrpE [Planctomycetes bacterium]|nr:nucleotide exchange factor GrpE [Planctomycetota bacterium]
MENNEPRELPSNEKPEERVENLPQPAKDSAGAPESRQTPDEQLQGLADALSTQNAILKDIKAELASRALYDAAKEKAIDKLSEELKLYRDNFIFQSQKPVFVEMIMLYDSLEQTLSILEDSQSHTTDTCLTVKNNLRNIKEELLEILYRRDVTPFVEHPETLDYKLHKTVGTVTTGVEGENNKVESIRKAGFRWNDKVTNFGLGGQHGTYTKLW